MSSTYNTSGGEASDVVSSGREYEVFLSFRGPDTRNGFTDHLYNGFIDAGIRAYRDDEELRVGEEIGPELIAAINQSKIAIPIFSKRYGGSKWCLKELAHIVERKRSGELKVMPIFYDITPSEVRNQTGDFADAFVSHEGLYGDETTKVWRNALKEVGDLKGWDAQSDGNRQEGKLVREVTNKVLRELKKALIVSDFIVGIDRYVEEILGKMHTETSGGGILGIHGMGGIGKTTLAKVIYNRLLSQFESSTFLADVRETSRTKGMVSLQSQLVSDLSKAGSPSFNNVDEGIAAISTRFSNKKVLVLLDDVDENFHLQGLVGKRNWFGQGTRIIITTRNTSVLDFIRVDCSFELTGLDPPQDLQLFSKHAFRCDEPPQECMKLSKEIVATTGGLPLALEVVGSLLCGKNMKYWDVILKKLEKVPRKEVIEKLKISFETLDEGQRHVFLDIACFFIGIDERVAIYYWDDSELFPEEAIEVLQQMSLIKVRENNLLWMHDQLRDYGREIVRQENIMDPGKRSRLWNVEEVTKVFATKKVRHQYWLRSNMSSSADPSNFLQEKPPIFSEVRWLSWPDFPHECIETSNFSLLNLTILDLSSSDFTIEWDGWDKIKMAKNLKVLDLSWCEKLVKTPDFSSHPLLERLVFQCCTNLVEIDGSIGKLKHLVYLDFSGCISLRKVPRELSCMGSLTQLIINQTNIVEIPRVCGMVKLEYFSAAYCTRLENCISFDNLTSLVKLKMRETRITLIPDSIGELKNLLELDLYGCKSLKKLPESIGRLVSLIELDISVSPIKELPNSIGHLNKLKILRMQHTLIRELPSTIRMAGNLEEIDAEDCELHGLPMLPESLVNLNFYNVDEQMIPDLSNLINLKQLKVRVRQGFGYALWLRERSLRFYSVGLELRAEGDLRLRKWALQSPGPWWIGRLGKVEKLELSFPTITTFHPDLCTLSLLTELKLTCCCLLQIIPMLPSSLTNLVVSSCYSLKTISDLSHLKKLSNLEIIETPSIELEGLHGLESLQTLRLDYCEFSEIDGFPENLRTLEISCCYELERLQQISKCKKLEEFILMDCPNLIEIQGRSESLESSSIEDCIISEYDGLPENLRTLRIKFCEKLKRSLQLSNCKKLVNFELRRCDNLVEIHGRLESLKFLYINCCRNLMKIPDVLNVKSLCTLSITSSPKLCREDIFHEGPILTKTISRHQNLTGAL